MSVDVKDQRARAQQWHAEHGYSVCSSRVPLAIGHEIPAAAGGWLPEASYRDRYTWRVIGDGTDAEYDAQALFISGESRPDHWNSDYLYKIEALD